MPPGVWSAFRLSASRLGFLRAAAVASIGLAAAGERPLAGAAQDRFAYAHAQLYVNATVIDGRGGQPRSSAVLVWGGRIQGVGDQESMAVPDGTVVVDLSGAYLLPGFIDAHASPRTTDDLRSMLASGITGVREGAMPLALFEERGTGAFGDDPVPRVYVGGPVLDAAGGAARGVPLDTEEAAVEEVRRQLDDGVRFISVSREVPSGWLPGIVRAARRDGVEVWADREAEGWLLGLRAGARVASPLVSGDPDLLPEDAREALARAAGGGARTRAAWLELLNPDGARVDAAVTALLSGDAAVTPLLARAAAPLGCMSGAGGASASDSEVGQAGDGGAATSGAAAENSAIADFVGALADGCAAVSAAERAALLAAWPKAQALVRALHDQGVRLLIGSDAPETTRWGAGYHLEMQLVAAAGIPELDVIGMATRNAAIALGQLHERGTLERGKRADFLVLERNPLADIRNASRISMVVIDGQAWGMAPGGRWERLRFD